MNSALLVPKLLAPAGGRNQFFAALNAGADGVYLGLRTFSARATAENFTLEDLAELMPTANKFGMEVLVALNTILEQKELHSLPQILAELCDVGVSGLIVQDLGVANLVRTHFPAIPLHASTQMAIHNLEGARQAHRLGFKRVVLARELTLTEIAHIRNAFSPTELELEIFCHGSLCYSYSGLCLFGGIQDGRSGNRGACPYPCRRLYKTNSESCYAMSMRDLDTLDILHHLVEAGPNVLKIEGRKKDAQYVTAVVQSYRARLNTIFGRDTLRASAPRSVLPSEQALREERAYSFQRNPTTLFFEGQANNNANTLDPRATTHLGLPIGNVMHSDASGVTFKTSADLSLHDGLSIEAPGEPIAFGISMMFTNGKSVTTAPCGATVTVFTPSANIAPNARIFKTRSDKLRSRVDALTHPPENERVRALLPFELDVQVEYPIATQPTQAKITLRAHKNNQTVLEKSFFPNAQPPNNIESDWSAKLVRDIGQTFSVFGDFNRTAKLNVTPSTAPVFIPASSLKGIKREFGSHLQNAFSQWRSELAQKAHSWIGEANPFSTINHTSNAAPSIKTDSLEVARSLPPQHVVFALNSSFLNAPSGEPQLSPRVRIALPLITRAAEMPALRSAVEKFLSLGHTLFEVGGLGALQVLQECAGDAFEKLHVSADASFYARNRAAITMLAQMGIQQFTFAHEETTENLSTEFFKNTLPCEMVVHSTLALMHSENCARRAVNGKCEGNACSTEPMLLTDGHGREFFAYRDGCRSVVTAKHPFSRLDKITEYKNLGITQFRAELLWKKHTTVDATEIFEKLS